MNRMKRYIFNYFIFRIFGRRIQQLRFVSCSPVSPCVLLRCLQSAQIQSWVSAGACNRGTCPPQLVQAALSFFLNEFIVVTHIGQSLLVTVSKFLALLSLL